MVNEFWKCLFNATVCMDLHLRSMKKIGCRYMRQPNVFIGAFYYSKFHLHQLGLLKLIKTVLKIFTYFVRFISSMESLSKGSHTKGAT